jgi:hypothetical protein
VFQFSKLEYSLACPLAPLLSSLQRAAFLQGLENSGFRKVAQRWSFSVPNYFGDLNFIRVGHKDSITSSFLREQSAKGSYGFLGWVSDDFLRMVELAPSAIFSPSHIMPPDVANRRIVHHARIPLIKENIRSREGGLVDFAVGVAGLSESHAVENLILDMVLNGFPPEVVFSKKTRIQNFGVKMNVSNHPHFLSQFIRTDLGIQVHGASANIAFDGMNAANHRIITRVYLNESESELRIAIVHSPENEAGVSDKDFPGSFQYYLAREKGAIERFLGGDR